MRRLPLLALIILLGAPSLSAERQSLLVPQTVYVGDRARLILSLDATERSVGILPFIEERAERLPQAKDLVILRIELENKDSGGRVLIDFVAYAPGYIALPRIELGNLVLTELHVHIASILDGTDSGLELAEPAEPLSAPGTALVLYGAIFILLALIFFIILFLTRILPLLRSFEENRLATLASRSIRRQVAHTKSRIGKTNALALLVDLVAELRSFLSRNTELNWRVLTPFECRELSAGILLESSDIRLLAELFKRCDASRFGGAIMENSELSIIVEEVSSLVDRLEERKTTLREGRSA